MQAPGAKVFWSFFSKKDYFLSYFLPPLAATKLPAWTPTTPPPSPTSA